MPRLTLKISVGSVVRWVTSREVASAIRQGAVTRGECLNSHTSPRHSPTISKSTNMVRKEMARDSTNANNSSKFLNPDPWARLTGRAHEEKIKVNGNTVTALLDTGSQVTHISLDYCQAMGIPINPIEHLVNIEGVGGCYKICGLCRSKFDFLWEPMCSRLRPSY